MFQGGSQNDLLKKNVDCCVNFYQKKYRGISDSALTLISRLCEKNPKKRCSIEEALELFCNLNEDLDELPSHRRMNDSGDGSPRKSIQMGQCYEMPSHRSILFGKKISYCFSSEANDINDYCLESTDSKEESKSSKDQRLVSPLRKKLQNRFST